MWDTGEMKLSHGCVELKDAKVWNCMEQTIKYNRDDNLVQHNEVARRDCRTDYMASECQAGAGRHFLR